MGDVLGEKTVGDFSIAITDDLLRQAQEILEREELTVAVEIPSRGNEVKALLSPKADDLIPLKEISHKGKTYYLGIPKS